MVMRILTEIYISALVRTSDTDPTDGVSPDMGVLGDSVNKLKDIIVGTVWAVGYVVVAVGLIMGFASLATARKNTQADDVGTAKNRIKWSIAGGIGLTLLSVPFDAFASIGRML